MAQVDQSSSWSNYGLYFELCSNYLYLLLFICSLFGENTICDIMFTETTLTEKHTKYHDVKASFRLSRPP